MRENRRSNPTRTVSPATLQQLNEFVDLGALVTRIAAGDRAFDALSKMLLEDGAFDLAECSADGLQLCENVDAVTALGHHARNPAHLSLDAVQAADELGIMVVHGVANIPR